MTRTDHATEGPAEFAAGRTLWRRWRRLAANASEPQHFLDLAALADGTLDEEERGRVMARIAADPEAASDVAAARALTWAGMVPASEYEAVVARALALVPEARRRSSGLAEWRRLSTQRMLQMAAQWGSLAAAMALAGWLGFAMGSGASLSLSQPAVSAQIGEDNFLPELLDPSTGFLHDLGAGQQT
jgi:anti-sigma factor RsiW